MEIFQVWWVYVLIGVIFLYVLTQSTVALIKAIRQAKKLGFSNKQIQNTVASSSIFSIAPSVAILLSLVILSTIFGPWVAGMRLGTLGAFTYELPAATNVANAFGVSIDSGLTPEMAVTALWVMTLGCLPPLLLVPFFYKKISQRFEVIKDRNSDFKDILMDALFLGMISAFVGFVVAPVDPDNTGNPYISILAIVVLFTSAILTVIFGLLANKKGFKWLKNYALPLSMLLAMTLAIVYSGWGLR